MSALRFWRVGLGAATVLCAGVALATPDPAFLNCTKTPTPEDVDGAKGAFKAGAQFEERGDYDRAIQYLKDAYNFDCTAAKILINLGRVQEKKGDRAGAISTYEAYLQRSPNSPEAATVTEKVKNLKASLQPAAAPTTGPVAPPPPVGSASAPMPTGSSAPVTPPPSEDGPRRFGVIPLVVAGGGVAIAIVGGILLGVGSGKVSTAEKACPDHSACADKQAISDGNSGRTLETVGSPVLIVGILAAGGGLGWELFGNKPKAAATTGFTIPGTTRKVAVAPAVGPGLAGLSFSGGF